MSEKGDIIKDTVGQSEAWSTVARGYDDMIRAFSAFHDVHVENRRSEILPNIIAISRCRDLKLTESFN